MLEPRTYAWLIPERLAVAERPGGGGRSHRRLRRDAEIDWWAARGVSTIVSCMRTRHGLLDAALAGFAVRWHPLVTPEQGAREIRALADTVAECLDAEPGAVLVHVDRPGEWLAGVDAALRLATGLAASRAAALTQAAADGLPVGEISQALVGARGGGARARASA